MHVSATPNHHDHDHDRHDPTLIAAHAAGDLTDTQAATAATLLSTCTACGDLHRDLVAIAAAARSLPRQLPAPRDYRLSSDHAAALRRGSWLRTLLRPFASPRSALQPLASVFATVGVAGLLVAAFVPSLLGGGAASAPSRETGAGAGAQGFSSAPYAPEAAGADASAGSHVKDATESGYDVAMGEGAGGSGQITTDTTDDRRLTATTPPNLLVLGSLGLLAAGIALFGLRLAARRLR